MILVGIGSNLPFCRANKEMVVARAISTLDRLFGVSASSSLYESPAWPNPSDPDYVNAVVRLESAPVPEELLKSLNKIEAAFGRQRTTRNAPRSLDLDLLAYNSEIIESERLTLPHKRLHARSFVLMPIAEIAPFWKHPTLNKSPDELLSDLGHCKIQRIMQKKSDRWLNLTK
ncbi:MAG: 2-amino-4-hydroxy-6-hydroxymethyldihydropteridine diphosphokinase [Pseudomonadota bacterium]